MPAWLPGRREPVGRRPVHPVARVVLSVMPGVRRKPVGRRPVHPGVRRPRRGRLRAGRSAPPSATISPAWRSAGRGVRREPVGRRPVRPRRRRGRRSGPPSRNQPFLGAPSARRVVGHARGRREPVGRRPGPPRGPAPAAWQTGAGRNQPVPCRPRPPRFHRHGVRPASHPGRSAAAVSRPPRFHRHGVRPAGGVAASRSVGASVRPGAPRPPLPAPGGPPASPSAARRSGVPARPFHCRRSASAPPLSAREVATSRSVGAPAGGAVIGASARPVRAAVPRRRPRCRRGKSPRAGRSARPPAAR